MLKRRARSARAQLFFEFAAGNEDSGVATSPARTKRKPAVKKQAPGLKNAHEVADNVYRDMCVVLHALAQKHITRSDFSSFSALVQCTKFLTDLGVDIATAPGLVAHMGAQESSIIRLAPQYRALKARALAGLSTVAELETKAPAKGSADYQQGMRDAFQHASELASMFLSDIEALIT